MVSGGAPGPAACYALSTWPGRASSPDQLATRLDQLAHGAAALVERRLLVRSEADLDDPLHPAGADDDGDADIEVLDPVLSRKMRRGRDDALLVTQIALGHGNGAGGRRVERAAFLEQLDDLAAAVRGPGHDGVDLLLRAPAHLDQVRDRDAGDGAVADQRDHRVPV